MILSCFSSLNSVKEGSILGRLFSPERLKIYSQGIFRNFHTYFKILMILHYNLKNENIENQRSFKIYQGYTSSE